MSSRHEQRNRQLQRLQAMPKLGLYITLGADTSIGDAVVKCALARGYQVHAVVKLTRNGRDRHQHEQQGNLRVYFCCPLLCIV